MCLAYEFLGVCHPTDQVVNESNTAQFTQCVNVFSIVKIDSRKKSSDSAYFNLILRASKVQLPNNPVTALTINLTTSSTRGSSTRGSSTRGCKGCNSELTTTKMINNLASQTVRNSMHKFAIRCNSLEFDATVCNLMQQFATRCNSVLTADTV